MRKRVALVVILCIISVFSVQASWLDGGSDTYIDDGDDVGIGTATPAQELEVSGIQRISRTSQGKLLEFYHTGRKQGEINFTSAISNAISVQAENDVLFKTSSTNRLVIINNGKVGIGTNNPQATMHISDTTATAPTITGAVFGTSGASDEFAQLELKGDASIGGGFIDFGYINDDFRGRILYTNNDDKMNIYANKNAMMTITSTGVGIKTESPAASLDVNGGKIKATDGLIIETRTDDPTSAPLGQLWLRTDLV